jgi:hypothetical protein|tara:strand:- start:516 stop:944 length:429 start_codon:yes stop_codon:yes gene_type:complete
MARRKSKAKRRRTQKQINLMGVAESALLLNAITTNVFNANIGDFVMGTQNGKFSAGSDGSTRLTLPEIFGVGSGGFGGTYGSTSKVQNVQDVIVWNVKKNAAPLIGSLILIPLAFKVGTKLTRKPRSTVNKGLKMSGLGVKI